MKSCETVTLFSTLATRKAIDSEVGEAFSQATGTALHVVYDPTTELAKRLRRGESGDVIIAVTSALHELAREKLVEAASIVPLARTTVGIAVAHGAERPDLTTVDNFVDAMLGARSVAYSQSGASGIYLREALRRLGILERVDERATVLDKGFTATAIVDGRSDIAVQQLSELAFVEGVDIVGPLPADISMATEFSGALIATIDRSPRARDLLAFLASDAVRAPYERSGLEAV